MTKPVDLYGGYAKFQERVLDAVRKETFGADIGQNSWVTVEEYERFLPWLDLRPEHHLLEVASGSGGPALHVARVTGCRVTGIDAHADGVATASQLSAAAAEAGRVTFRVADACRALPFEESSFDALLCIDAMNHFPDRAAVLREWHRVLRPGRRILFTDPVVVTGPVTHEEIAVRSSIGEFLFTPPAVNEALLTDAGFHLVEREDVTGNAAHIAARWRDSRANHRRELIEMEGAERFENLQRFFDTVHRLAHERRLSRIVYVAEKPADARR